MPLAPRRLCWPCLLTLAACLVPAVSRAQGGFLAQGVLDAELWKTDTGSTLLARNAGHAGVVARADAWAALEPLRDLVLFGEVMVETGPARARVDSGNALTAKQFGLRYSPSDAFTIEGGRIQHLVGTFASRRLSFRNPLVGAPDGYATSYPYGVAASGTVGVLDYRAGVLSLPLFRPGYTPTPTAALRPAFGAGITPFTGLRVGLSGTVGPYLSSDLTSAQLGGRGWREYHQRVAAADVELAAGYFEGHAEAARGSYDVPGRADPILGYNGYLEGKYTFTPRVYLAARVERNDYPFIRPLANGQWVAVRSAFSDAELGGGYRPTSSSLLKLSLRADRWTPSPNYGAPQANGYAVVMQGSQQFDLVEMLKRRP